MVPAPFERGTDMSQTFHRWLQERLNAHGFPLIVDGMWGSESRSALIAFQRKSGLRQSGSADAGTVTALRLSPDGRDTGPRKIEVLTPWHAELLRRMGLHEVRDNAKLFAWLRSDGRTLGDPAKLPWCGDAVQTAIALTLPNEPQLANPYLARNWLKFGRRTQPRRGAIMVFWRGSRCGTSGHVAIYNGEDRTHYEVDGGNQNNAITRTRIKKDRFLGAVWPVTDQTETFAVERALNAPISTNEA